MNFAPPRSAAHRNASRRAASQRNVFLAIIAALRHAPLRASSRRYASRRNATALLISEVSHRGRFDGNGRKAISNVAAGRFLQFCIAPPRAAAHRAAPQRNATQRNVQMLSERRPSIRPRYRAPPIAELTIHFMVVDVLRWAKPERRGWTWTHLPFGEKRDPATAGKLERMGAKAGWPDFVFIGPPGIFFLELKSKSGELSDHQDAFFAAMRARNIECRVARSYDEAVRILSGWGVVPASLK
jgi:hypothetical protein